MRLRARYSAVGLLSVALGCIDAPHQAADDPDGAPPATELCARWSEPVPLDGIDDHTGGITVAMGQDVLMLTIGPVGADTDLAMYLRDSAEVPYVADDAGYLAMINTGYGEQSAELAEDGRVLFLTLVRGEETDIFVSSRTADDEAFVAPTAVQGLDAPGVAEADPALWYPDNGLLYTLGTGDERSLHRAICNATSSICTPTGPLGPTGAVSSPTITDDGLTLYYERDDVGIVAATREDIGDELVELPEPCLGPEFHAPHLSRDGTALFMSRTTDSGTFAVVASAEE